MWTKLCFGLALLCGLSVHQTAAQDILEVRLNCSFETYPIYNFLNYACVLRDVEFDFSNPFYYIMIDGVHEEGRTNADVRNFAMAQSSTNIIPSNIFQIFPNVVAIEAANSGIVAIPAANFAFAPAIEGLFISGNNIPALTGAPFWGRSGITSVSLYSNGIESIAQGYFNGLSGLNYLSLAGNRLTSITPEHLAPLVSLRNFLASSNQFTALSGRIFSTNRQIELIGLEYNSINAVGRGAFDDLESLAFVGFSGNECFNGYFDASTGIIEDFIEALEPCFENAIPEPPRTRTLVLELRGNMTLLNEYREELLTVQGRIW